jgi:two-component system nitrate/nitrite sensor histidine kinase NarX
MNAIVPQMRRPSYPLFMALAGVVGGCIATAVLSGWGSLAIHIEFTGYVDSLLAACLATQESSAACQIAGAMRSEFLERSSAMLMLQFLCVLLLLVGLGLIAARGYHLLVRRTSAAIALTSEPTTKDQAGDEFERVRSRLATLHARTAGLEAEAAWHRRVSEAQNQRHTTVTQVSHEVARLISDAELSAGSLRSALGVLGSACGARTVALVLDARVSRTLGFGETIATHHPPLIANQLPAEYPPRDVSGRLVAGPGEFQTLIVPLCSGGVGIGALIAEFAGTAQVDDASVRLAETVARMAALALVGLSDSMESRRLALLEERSAIAAELHDSLAQSLGFMRIQLARLQRNLDGQSAAGEGPGDAVHIAAEIKEGLNAAYGEVRELISTFRTRMDEGGLIEAVSRAVEGFGAQTGIGTRLTHELGRCRLDVNEEFHILQVIRESLANVSRHSGAQLTAVDLRYGPAHEFTVTIDDDGSGFSGNATDTGHYGLSIMRERTASLSGTLEVVARPAGGTRVRLAFPPKRLPSESDEAVNS